ncbi:hypothetical protein FDECE_5231 [Fusarium decemcellulare]|nr:hypothetical protein FDECE_5231 [Fusarium decemcellulare]
MSSPDTESRSTLEMQKEAADGVEPGPPPALPASLEGTAKPGRKRREYFADPPMTPEEAEEEKNEIYSPDLSFVERMQSCIQRFRSRRRLQGDRTYYFNEYLFLGGVDTNPGSFGGLGRQDLQDLTPAERREATATDVIYGTTSAGDKFYNGDDEIWSVDFASVVAGFISVTLVRITSFDLAKMAVGIDTLDNFLRYILHHDVCPEYQDDINAALQVCEAARVEWPKIRQLYNFLPGHFNLAAAELFCSKETAENSWSFHRFKRPEGFDAKSVFFSAFALMDEPELFERLSAKNPKVVKEFTSSVELVQVFHPSEDIIKRVKSLVIGDSAGKHVPIGKATFKQTTIQDGYVSPHVRWPISEDVMTLFFDASLLDNMVPGMKATMDICELDAGLRFVQRVDIIVPSFYTFLPQELMRGYKPPVKTNRPPPSVHDPFAEEREE